MRADGPSFDDGGKRTCANCWKRADNLLACKCRISWYCDESCQIKDRRLHKRMCRQIQKDVSNGIVKKETMEAQVSTSTMYMALGQSVAHFGFPSEEVMNRWDVNVKLIKQKMMNINEAANDLADEDVADEIEHWFSLLDGFQDKFGTMVVPQDVRAAAGDNNIFLSKMNRKTVKFPKKLENAPEHPGCVILLPSP